MNRSKLLATALLVGVFVSGVIVGGAGSAVASLVNPAPDRERPRRSYVDRLNDKLDLNPYQHVKVEEVIEQYNDAMHELWRTTRPRADEIRAGVRTEILRLLDETQTATYQEMIQRSDSIRAARRAEHDRNREEQ